MIPPIEGAGKIRWEQARVVMSKMGRKLTDDQFAKLVDRYDCDKNGMIFSASASARVQAHANIRPTGIFRVSLYVPGSHEASSQK